ncbi:MAG: selenocysteine-specific translation elongation factor [Candidatus Lokiarchaeota archaeon]|nr:selenocysteine-specific translation elongation factor [Candidatus Lokiarchaeota archaeon]
MDAPIPVHIGLVGHIDHGKTELARALSEKVFTAGLDRHPQAKKRGITIDLGFTMFNLGNFLVTLVDAPGHADLIRSVVAGANIIDAAILVVAADEGPKIQTGEHIVVLKSMGITNICVALTKCDLVGEKSQKKVASQMRDIFKSIGMKSIDIVPLSAKTGYGLEALREVLLNTLKPKTRLVDGSFLLPIDHAFSVRGHGTVATGTILSGSISLGDSIELMPQGTTTKLRAIQTFGVGRESARAGDRVGFNIPDIKSEIISRGNYLCSPGSMKKTSHLVVRIERNALYKGRISKEMTVSATVGMPTVTAKLIPFVVETEKNLIIHESTSSIFDALLLLQHEIAVQHETKVLLLRTDLPPNSMRIIGSGYVINFDGDIPLHKKRVRYGHITRIREDDVLVEGLVSNKEAALKLRDSPVRTTQDISGVIKMPFGTRGVLSVVFDQEVNLGEKVIFEQFVEVKISND